MLTNYVFPASSAGASGIPGFLVSAILMDLFGRRIAHALVVVPGAIGWVLIYLSSDVSTILAGRILGGFTGGATVSLGAIAIGEYTSPKYRGMFLNLKTVAVSLGGMIVHILAHYFAWRTIALVSIVPYIVAIIIIMTWRESPAWLASKQRFKECEESFFYLRGKNDKTYQELEDLISAQSERSLSRKDLRFSDKALDIVKKFTRPDFLKPLCICFMGAVLLESSGRHIFPAYALLIIGEITGDSENSFFYTLCLDLIIVASALSSSALIRCTKRRTLLFSTGFASCVVLLSCCAYLFLASRGVISQSRVVPIALFVLFFVLANLGCTPIPLALLGEVYPLAHRAVGSATTGIAMSLVLMLGLQSTPLLLENLKIYGAFAVYGGITAFTLLVLFFILPETKDKTLQEIENYFNYGTYYTKADEERDEEKVKMVPPEKH